MSRVIFLVAAAALTGAVLAFVGTTLLLDVFEFATGNFIRLPPDLRLWSHVIAAVGIVPATIAAALRQNKPSILKARPPR
jgi:hypothetical protein